MVLKDPKVTLAVLVVMVLLVQMAGRGNKVIPAIRETEVCQWFNAEV